VSDDRTLTNLALQSGYRTAYQYTSLVYTDSPTSVRKLFRQQLRWARGSQYNTLRMLPWMLAHAPLLAVFFLADIALPFLLVGAIIGWIYRAATGTGVNFYAAIIESYGISSGVLRVAALVLVSSVMSMGIRQLRHLSERPGDFYRMPVFVLISTLFLMPVRLLGFFRMAHVSGWGTRAHAYAGARHETHEPAPALAASAGSAAGCGVPNPVHRTPDGPPSARRSRQRRRLLRLNPAAAVPYLIGATVLALEVLHHA
jgi:cellulose synthase/poly-beta-1,6-N-acetylglucosamine synthase-like glycosyltransferase